MRNSRSFSLTAILPVVAVFVGLISFSSTASANEWAGGERSGSCYIPSKTKSWDCRFGPYTPVKGARSIGGFYINPIHESRKSGDMPIEYRINGGEWIRRDLKLNSTNKNYIDFGKGVKSFEYRFLFPYQMEFGGGSTTTFKFNYDLDR